MTITNHNGMTLLEFAKLTAIGNIGPIIDTCVDVSEFIRYMRWVPCNKGTHHETPVENGEPMTAWVSAGDFVPVSHGSNTIIKDIPAMIKAWSSTPLDYIKIFGYLKDSERIEQEKLKRFFEEKKFQKKMTRDMTQALLYGDTDVNVKTFKGIAPRYNTLSGEIGEQVINYGGTGNDLTSIYMVNISPETMIGIYPRGSTAGLNFTDHKTTTETNAQGAKRVVADGEYEWQAGLAIRNFRAVTRIANIPMSELETESNMKIIKKLNEAYERKLTEGNTYFLIHRKVHTAIKNSLVERKNNLFGTDTFDGHKCMHFEGIPLLQEDQISLKETKVI